MPWPRCNGRHYSCRVGVRIKPTKHSLEESSMKKRASFLILLSTPTIPLLPVRTGDKSVSFFMSLNGDDTNSGTREKPLATLEAACEATP
jgi:hypothetical protein